MNPNTEIDELRSEIELTRRRMDDTMDALTERMQGRHLLDEAIGFFRRSDARETGARLGHKLSDATDAATHAVVNTVKTNPLPILLITAGAAWLAYSASRGRSAQSEFESEDTSDRYDPDVHYDHPISYPEGGESFAATEDIGETEETSRFERLKETVGEKSSAAKEQLKQKWSDLSERTRSKIESARERAAAFGEEARMRSREMYDRTRDRISETVDRHPLETGLACLAVGVLVGIALPSTEPVNRVAGPAVDRLKDRTREAGRDVLEKGKSVVRAAANAAREEAQAQGLTPEHLRARGEAGLERAGTAAPSEMPAPGAAGSGLTGSQPGGAASTTPPPAF